MFGSKNWNLKSYIIGFEFKGESDWGKNERMKTKNNTKIAEKIIIRCHFVSKTALVIFLTALLAMILIACGIFIHLSVASMVEKLSSTLVHVYDWMKRLESCKSVEESIPKKTRIFFIREEVLNFIIMYLFLSDAWYRFSLI